MINVAKFARTKNIPFFGICLGMQVAVIEFARNVLKISANSTEFEKTTKHPVIALITEWMDKKGLTQIRNENSDKGGTMRLGSQVCILEKTHLTQLFCRYNLYQIYLTYLLFFFQSYLHQ